MPTLSLNALAREFADYQLALSRPQLSLVRSYLELLLRWNRRLRLTGLRDARRIVRELFCESVYLTHVLPLEGQLVDIGTGAGFPGLALKLVVPQLHAVLIEANQRKCAFLKEAIRHLQLAEVTVFGGRFEEFVAQHRAGADIVTTRAVAIERPLLLGVSWVLREGGRLAAFTTRRLAPPRAGLGPGSGLEWVREVPVPHSRQRLILVGRKPAAGGR
ncbi:MAG: 16S rRNA (guanine(527)-N(7))-methyltransferase RsmG [Terriglobia bacterium]